MALWPGLSSPAARQLLPGLGDRPPGNSATTKEKAGWDPTEDVLKKERGLEHTGTIPEWRQRREVPQVRARQHQSLSTKDKTQVLKQPWQSSTSEQETKPATAPTYHI